MAYSRLTVTYYIETSYSQHVYTTASMFRDAMLSIVSLMQTT